MSSVDFSKPKSAGTSGFLDRVRLKAQARTTQQPEANAAPQKVQKSAPSQAQPPAPAATRKRERFLPITRYALIDRLTDPTAWPPGQAADARRFFRYLDFWRQQQYNALLLDLDQCYEPFSPDSDLLTTRRFTDDDKARLKHRVFNGVESLLVRANYERIDPHNLDVIMTRASHYGLDLQVDMEAFEHIAIYYRGATNRRDQKRSYRSFMRLVDLDVAIYKRLCVMFKLKSFEAHVQEFMKNPKIGRDEAERRVGKMRSALPPSISDQFIYLKLFKNIPQTDLEMVFPNTRVKFRAFDKLRLGVTAGGGLGMGAVGAASKLALLATNPLAAAGAAVGLGSVAARQAVAFMNQKQRYMVVMAQNLYFHSMADNRGAILKIAARGAEEDIKEEVLLYAVLAKEKATRKDLPAIDAAIEQFLTRSFGINVDFEIEDALDRLIRDGIVTEAADGTLATLRPADAAKHIDDKWDIFLDHLPDVTQGEGYEVEAKR